MTLADSFSQHSSPLNLPLCLQDEMEELRSEMLEMRDMYMEDDVYQLQELRQQLEQVRQLANTPTARPPAHGRQSALNQGLKWAVCSRRRTRLKITFRLR